MSWQAASMLILAVVIAGGFIWFERSRPSARILAAVAAMAALGVAGRIAFAPIPNVVATTDVVLLAGYTLGGGPGFAVGALSGFVSNFWLGQGPWTPWQMTGWGVVGIAGALLAGISRRRLGRLQLAAAAALAGLAYGALLDLSVMVSFGGEQSLDRYLALSARGIPFNIAHAVGNFVLMFAAGPAMVRMLDRYRERFEFRWSDAPLGRAAVALAVAACLLAPLLAPQPGVAADGRGGASDWLTQARNDDGGYGTEPGAPSSPGMTGWAMLGLEAAGVNPLDLVQVGPSPVDYLRATEAEITSTSDLERTILALEGAGVDADTFAGRDLVAELGDRQAANGSFERQVNLTAFAILAQRAAGVSGPSVSEAAGYLRSIQNDDGGWGSVDGAESESDSTGAVMQALAAAPGSASQLADAARWLEDAQHGDGGWSLTSGATSNAQSTAWAVQGLLAAGRGPGTVEENGQSGLDYIAARQAADGHYAYSASSDQTPVWVTAQGLTASGRAPFPIAAVTREEPEPVATQADDPASPGYTGGDLGELDLGASDDYASGSQALASGGNDGIVRGGSGRESDAAPGGPETAIGRERIAANAPGSLTDFVQSAAAPAALPVQNSPLPTTLVFLAGLGLLAAALGAGFLRYRRRLP